jgi:Winged helix DNA-binding domain
VRHLAAFGPALVNDIQAWSGLTRLRDPVEQLGGDLRRFRDEHGRLLYDLSDALRPAPDTPAPPLFLPLRQPPARPRRPHPHCHDDHRRRVCIGAVVEPTVLLDGQVAATWRLTQNPTRATLTIEPLTRLSRTDRTAVTVEGERLLAFAAAPPTTTSASPPLEASEGSRRVLPSACLRAR